jgi:seryl-tRNA(Sec) selenium transferase
VDTAEELVAELERQMKGFKDKHDLFIDEYMKKMQEMAEKKILDEDKKLEESRKRHEGMAPISGSQRALTTEENQELMARKKSNNLVIVPSDNRVSSEDELRYLKKIGSKVLTAKGK